MKFNIRGAGWDSLDNDVSVDTEKSSKWGHQEMQTSRETQSHRTIPKMGYIWKGSNRGQYAGTRRGMWSLFKFFNVLLFRMYSSLICYILTEVLPSLFPTQALYPIPTPTPRSTSPYPSANGGPSRVYNANLCDIT